MIFYPLKHQFHPQFLDDNLKEKNFSFDIIKFAIRKKPFAIKNKAI